MSVYGLMRAQDAANRRLARTELRRPLVLEAGAGTGKTGTLVARALTWALGPGWERAERRLAERDATTAADVAASVLERMAAITFTEKAAAEMEQRIARALADILEERAVVGLPGSELPGDGDVQKERARALLAALHRMQIGTIHAFCRRLLAAHPLEAGLDPTFQVDAEGLGLRSVVEDVVTEALADALGPEPDEDMVALALEDRGPERLAEAVELLALESVPPEALEDDPFGPERVAGCRDRLLAAAASLETALRPALAGGGLDRAPAGRAAAKAVVRLVGAAPGVRTVEELLALVSEVATDGVLKRLAEWGRSRLGKSEQAAFGHVATHVLAEQARALRDQLHHLSKVRPDLLRALLRVVRPLLLEVGRRLRRRGVQTFGALLHDARRLLEAHPAVLARVRSGLDQLLVDEFQDTDPVQYDLVRRIALEGPEDQRPGLFLVGDPKQSIYGWRQADLRAYEEFVQRVEAAGGERLPLVVNFRSVPAVLDEVERTVAPVMHAEAGLQPEFEALVPSEDHEGDRGFRRGGRRPVEYWISWDRGQGAGTKAERAREVEALAVARDLSELRAGRHLAWRDAAILMRATTQQETYLRALREAGVPYVVERDRSYYRRREVIDAAALVRTVVDPNDLVALVTLLRSPVVGVPDAALIPLWRARLPEQLAALSRPSPAALGRIDATVAAAADATPADAPGIEHVSGWPASLRHAARALADLRRSFADDPADVFVERLQALLLPLETEAARFLGLHRTANLERFFRRALDALAGSDGGPQALLRALRRGTAEGLEEPEGAPGDETLDAVRVMSVHMAKGLTFEHVYLVDLHHELGGEHVSPAHVERLDEGVELSLLGLPSLGFHRVRERRRRVEEAEAVRLLYVAATRPSHRIVLAGNLPAGEGTIGHLLEGRRGGLRKGPELLEGAAADAPAVHVDEAGVRWVLPDHEGAATGRPRRSAGVTITAAAARRDAERLREERDAAARRAERPLTGAAASHAERPDLLVLDEPDAAPLRAEASAAVGTAVHRVLEDLDLAAEPERELERQRGRLPSLLAPAVTPAELEGAVGQATGLLRRLAGSRLLERLRALGDRLLARELPVLLHPDGTGRGADAPTGAIVGTVDVLYRDAPQGGLVVADWKTDRVTTEDDVGRRAELYAEQGRLYVEAVARAFPDLSRPRFELWFLHADRVVAGTGRAGE